MWYEPWGIRNAERRKVNVLEMKCLRSFLEVSRMERVREVRIRAGMKTELAGIEWMRGYRNAFDEGRE